MTHELFQIVDEEITYAQVWVDTDKKDQYEAAKMLDEVFERARIRAGSLPCSSQLRVEFIGSDSQIAEI